MRSPSSIAVLLLCGCSSFDPSGAFVGDATSSTETRTYLAPPALDGSSNVDSTRNQNTTAGARVVIRRVDERHLELELGFCRLRAVMGEGALANSGGVVEGQSCPVDAGGRTEPVPIVSGNVDFTPDARAIDIQLAGSLRRDANGVPEGYFAGWTWTFSGQRPPDPS
jgi:hypothetical protein